MGWLDQGVGREVVGIDKRSMNGAQRGNGMTRVTTEAAKFDFALVLA